MDGRPKLADQRILSHALDEHNDLGGVLGYTTTMLIRSFIANGGDFTQPTEIRFTEEPVGPEGERRLCARLHGWGTSRSSTSATTASSAS